MTEKKLSRRAFVVGSVGLLGLLSAVWSRLFYHLPHLLSDPHFDPLKLKLKQFFDDQPSALNSAKVIGLQYLKTKPHEADAKILLELIFQRAEGEAFVKNLPLQEMKNLISHTVQEDFDKDCTSIVNGWVLSQTELRLCALLTVV